MFKIGSLTYYRSIFHITVLTAVDLQNVCSVKNNDVLLTSTKPLILDRQALHIREIAMSVILL